MRIKQITTKLAVAATIISIATTHASAQTMKPSVCKPVPPEQRMKVQPMLDTPLRAPSVCKGPDGTYYLTGTLSDKDEGKDWKNNAGIRLWKSTDMKTWEDMGLVFDPSKLGFRPHYAWIRTPVGVMDRPDTLRQNSAIAAPEIHYINGNFWICFSVNDYGTGLLKSTTGKPEGPYEAPGKKSMITNWGCDPSLFQDDGGSIYWLWSGPGLYIAKMKEDMSGLAENPRALFCGGEKQHQVVGRYGPFLYKVNGKYHLSAKDYSLRHCITASDVFVATATESLLGPYSKRTMLLKNSGQTTVFKNGQDQWFATYCGLDRSSAFRDRAGIVPLEWIAGYVKYYLPYRFFPNRAEHLDGSPLMTRNKHKVVTEKAPWHKIRPLKEPVFYKRKNGLHEVSLMHWDTNMIQAPDGCFYFTGSQSGVDGIKHLRVWKSRDLKHWEAIDIRTFQDEKALSQARKDFVARPGNLGMCYMDCKISWLDKQKTFAVSYTVYGTKDPRFAKEKGERDVCSGVLLSESGKIEGPWVWHDTASHSASYKELEDGRTIVSGGINDIYIVKPGYWDEHADEVAQESRRREFTQRQFRANPRDTFGSYVEDSNGQLIRIKDKWVMLPCEIAGKRYVNNKPVAYSTAFMVADKLEGPWARWKPAVPYGGHASIFKGLDRHFYGLVWHATLDTIWCDQPALVRMNVTEKDGELSMEIDDEWTADDYKPVEVEK